MKLIRYGSSSVRCKKASLENLRNFQKKLSRNFPFLWLLTGCSDDFMVCGSHLGLNGSNDGNRSESLQARQWSGRG